MKTAAIVGVTVLSLLLAVMLLIAVPSSQDPCIEIGAAAGILWGLLLMAGKLPKPPREKPRS